MEGKGQGGVELSSAGLLHVHGVINARFGGSVGKFRSVTSCALGCRAMGMATRLDGANLHCSGEVKGYWDCISDWEKAILKVPRNLTCFHQAQALQNCGP